MSPDPKAASRSITPDTCWKVLEGAAASDHLKRATRLKEFLYYVGKRSIKEGSSEIHEQEIGQAVFGRKDSYDTSQDNIVRVSATELRRRVEAYFAAEGKDEPLILRFRAAVTRRSSIGARKLSPPIPQSHLTQKFPAFP